MNQAEGPVKRICPRCKQTDLTTFSKCRSCGTSYDFKAEKKSRDIALGLPMILLIGFTVIGLLVWQSMQLLSMYSHPDKLIGKSWKCRGTGAFVSTDQKTLLKFNHELAEAAKTDPKLQGTGFKGLGGLASAASSLNWLASGKESSFEIAERYLEDGQVVLVRSDGYSPLSVTVTGTNGAAKYPLVQVKLLNGPRAGTVWWMSVDTLNLEEK